MKAFLAIAFTLFIMVSVARSTNAAATNQPSDDPGKLARDAISDTIVSAESVYETLAQLKKQPEVKLDVKYSLKSCAKLVDDSKHELEKALKLTYHLNQGNQVDKQLKRDTMALAASVEANVYKVCMTNLRDTYGARSDFHVMNQVDQVMKPFVNKALHVMNLVQDLKF